MPKNNSSNTNQPPKYTPTSESLKKVEEVFRKAKKNAFTQIK